MRRLILAISISAIIVLPTQATEKMTASLADTAWNGITIPDGQQCDKFGGQGSSPKIHVANIPAGTDALVVEYSDESYEPMRDGGHGKIGYRILSKAREITIPAVKGHSFDLPEPFFIVEPQRAPQWDKAGAYLPPCSGGKGNTYTATIKAVKLDSGRVGETITDSSLVLGKY